MRSAPPSDRLKQNLRELCDAEASDIENEESESHSEKSSSKLSTRSHPEGENGFSTPEIKKFYVNDDYNYETSFSTFRLTRS